MNCFRFNTEIPMAHCASLPDEYREVAVAQIPALTFVLEELSVDALTWSRTLRCSICGQLWEERFEERGHGEVPTVRKTV